MAFTMLEDDEESDEQIQIAEDDEPSSRMGFAQPQDDAPGIRTGFAQPEDDEPGNRMGFAQPKVASPNQGLHVFLGQRPCAWPGKSNAHSTTRS